MVVRVKLAQLELELLLLSSLLVYSLTESMELQQDLARGLHKLVTGLLLLKEARSE